MADFGMARKMYYEGNYERTGVVLFFLVMAQRKKSNNNFMSVNFLGSDASQMDGRRVVDGSHLFNPIGRLVLRDSSVGDV